MATLLMAHGGAEAARFQFLRQRRKKRDMGLGWAGVRAGVARGGPAHP